MRNEEDRFAVKDTSKLVYNIAMKFLRQWGSEVGPYGIAVYNALKLHADWDYSTCYPSHTTMAKLIGCSRSQVIRELKKLRKLGLIDWKRRRNGNGDLTSHLYIILPVPDRGVVSGGNNPCVRGEQEPFSPNKRVKTGETPLL